MMTHINFNAVRMHNDTVLSKLTGTRENSGEGFNIAPVLWPIPFHVNEIKYV